MRSNCIAWAVALYYRRRARGKQGYLLIRKSRLGPFFHMLYAERCRDGRLRVLSFVPEDKRIKTFPPPCFKGASQWGDHP